MSSVPKRHIYDRLSDYLRSVLNELRSVKTANERKRVLEKYKSLTEDVVGESTIKYITPKQEGGKVRRYSLGSLFEQQIYEYILKNPEGKNPNLVAIEFLSHNSTLEMIYEEYNEIYDIVYPKEIKYEDETVKNKLLVLALIDQGRPMTQKQLMNAMSFFLSIHPTTMTPEEMHDFYRRNYTYQQTVKAKPSIKPKEKPKKDPFTSVPQKVKFQTSPWTSRQKYYSFKKRNSVDEEKIEERRWEQGPNTFNMKKQSKYMRHMLGPRHTFIIDYFFPGKFMYLLAINVNTRKAFFSVPKEIRRVGHNWNIPTNPKANADSAIRSLEDIMKQTPVKGLIMDQEPAWQNDFHSFCNREGIKWRHYIKNNIKGLIETNENSRGNHSTTALIDRLCMGGDLSIDPDQMRFLIDEYNASPHATLTRLLGKPTSPNMVDADPKLEDDVVLRLLIENATIEMQDDYDIVGKKVRILNESSGMDKLKRKLLPGIWTVEGRQNGLFVCKQGQYTVKVSRWMITPI